MEEFQGLNEDQKRTILQKRQEMFQKMGVKNAGKMMNESIVATNSANSSMAAKLAAIRNGSAKAELNKYINATGKNAPSGSQEFQPLPEPTKRKNPNQTKEEVAPEFKQELQDFSRPSAVNNQELSAIDAMFGGDGPARMPMGNQSMQHHPVNQEISLDSVMPHFNPQAALQQKMRNQSTAKPQANSPYLKFASDAPVMPQGEFDEFSEMPTQQPAFNMGQLQVMMETIAKGIAEKTIRSVLNEYSEQQKGKVFFEYYNREKGIIKASDGKYYKLTQVELKKKA